MLSISELPGPRPTSRARPLQPLRADEARPSAPPVDDDDDPRLPEDRVSISSEARDAGPAEEAQEGGPADEEKEGGTDALSAEDKALVAQLQARDAHVRSHEAAHQSAGGGLTGAASFSYETGPDGRSYAVGGEVPIRIESGRTPEETIQNAARARAAALAPPDPSPADLGVAASASQLERDARAQLAKRAAEAYRAGSEGLDERGLPRADRRAPDAGAEHGALAA